MRDGNLLADLRAAATVVPRNPPLPSRCAEGPKRVEKQTLVIGCNRPRADLTNRQKYVEIISNSPSRRFQVQAEVWDAKHSLWVYSPSIWDAERHLYILSFEDKSWSMDKSVWLSENTVSLAVRKFPGNHRPEQLSVDIDCAKQLATMSPTTQMPLVDLESALNSAITWG